MQVVDSNATRRRPRVLLAACGNVSALKFRTLCHCFCDWAEVRAVATKAALFFIDRASLPRNVFLYVDDDDWTDWGRIGDNVLHIHLSTWADILVIAPLSANTLAKIAGGLCDNLLTCIVRAWDYRKSFFVAPSMDASMWSNSFTERHLGSLDDLGISLLRQNNGVMAEPTLIASTLRQLLASQFIVDLILD